jgi:hypothetical protein
MKVDFFDPAENELFEAIGYYNGKSKRSAFLGRINGL